MTNPEAKALITQLTRIAVAMEESNRLKKQELLIEKRKFRIIESKDSQLKGDAKTTKV